MSDVCPIEWCTGRVGDHGGYGDGPEDWVHSDDGAEVVHGAALYRSREGAGPDLWELVAGGAVVARGADLRVLAVKLRDIAAAVEEVAERGALL